MKYNENQDLIIRYQYVGSLLSHYRLSIINDYKYSSCTTMMLLVSLPNPCVNT